MRLKGLEDKRGKTCAGHAGPVSLVSRTSRVFLWGWERLCLRLPGTPSVPDALTFIARHLSASGNVVHGGLLSWQRVGELGGSAAKPENKTSLSAALRLLFPPNSGGRGTSGFLWRLLGVSPCEPPASCGCLWPSFPFTLTLLYVENVAAARWWEACDPPEPSLIHTSYRRRKRHLKKWDSKTHTASSSVTLPGWYFLYGLAGWEGDSDHCLC